MISPAGSRGAPLNSSEQTQHVCAPASAGEKRLLLTAVAILAAATLLHLYVALHFPLAADETYYWEWSRRPAWGYYDQGPMVAWWIRAGCFLFGHTQLGVRVPIVVGALATDVVLFLFFRELLGARTAIPALIFSVITPVSLVGGFVATYDPVMVFFWALAMWAGWRALQTGSLTAWGALGLSCGLGLLSKHTMVLFLPCAALALWWMPSARRQLRGPGPWLALVLAAIVVAPHLAWQAGHNWMTFRHLFVLTGKGVSRPAPLRMTEFFGSQVALLTPLLFFGVFAAMVATFRRRGSAPPEHRYLWALGPPVLLFFLLLTLKSRVQANWSVAGWLTPPALYAIYLHDPAGGTFRRRFAAFSGAFCVLVGLLLSFPEVGIVIGAHLPRAWFIQITKMYGGPELGAAVERERALMTGQGGPSPVVGATTYDTTSRLSFYTPGQPEAWCLFLGTRDNSYLLWNDRRRPPAGGNAVLVDDFASDDPQRPKFEQVFDRVEPVAAPVDVYIRGIFKEPVHTYYLYRCYGYHPHTAAEHPSAG